MQQQTIDGEFTVMDAGSDSDPFDNIIRIDRKQHDGAAPESGSGGSGESSESGWLQGLANPGTNLGELAVVVAPSAYLWDLAVRTGKDPWGQALYAAVGAGMGVLLLQVAKKQGWV